ncbi:MAG: hypothetical protein AB7R89_17620 [Dehalococcoidia bacterium]
MSEQTEQTTEQPGAVPARIDLEDFIEAVTRGVARALAAADDVSGYALTNENPTPGTLPIFGQPPIFIGLVAPPSGPRGPVVPREVPIRR